MAEEESKHTTLLRGGGSLAEEISRFLSEISSHSWNISEALLRLPSKRTLFTTTREQVQPDSLILRGSAKSEISIFDLLPNY